MATAIPESTDCDDNDPNRFHGNARPRNCCTCTDKASCAKDHTKLADMSKVRLPAPLKQRRRLRLHRQARSVFFVDDDCDGYSPNDPVVTQRDCDDTNPNIYPVRRKLRRHQQRLGVRRQSVGWLRRLRSDGDGYQRNDKAQGGICPTAAYTSSGKKIDCATTTIAACSPGSTMYNGSSQIMGFADPRAKKAAGRKSQPCGGCAGTPKSTAPRRKMPTVTAPPRNGCPTAACDVDGDGFPKDNTAACNPAVFCRSTATTPTTRASAARPTTVATANRKTARPIPVHKRQRRRRLQRGRRLR